jgi:hypothetical protein
MVKKVIIVHGWDGNPVDSWKTWLKKELESKGFEVIAPQMPGGKYPKLIEWINVFSEVVNKPDEDTYFVGHSLGCVAILKYIEQLKINSKIGGVILVSGFISSLGISEIENFVDVPLNPVRVKDKLKKIVAIHSDNDSSVPLKFAEELRNKLGVKLILEHNKGHISESDKVKELPSLLNLIIEMSK